MRKLLRSVAHGMLPRSIRPRQIRFGMARGATANIDFQYDTAFYFGRHERDLHQHYRKLLKPGMRCFDVGMYRGWDALMLAHLTRGPVVSFDGNPRCLEWTAEFLSPSGRDVHLKLAYLGDGEDGNPTLDDAAAEHYMPEFIKIDVEGAEAGVLRGAKRILSERMPSMVVEMHSAEVEAQCAELLRSIGYVPQIVTRTRGHMSESIGAGHNRWLVCHGRVA